jgi:hypothetical protein
MILPLLHLNTLQALGAQFLSHCKFYFRLRVLPWFISLFFSSNGSTAPWGPRPPHFLRLHNHTVRHTTLDRTPLKEGPAHRRDLYLTTHNTRKRQTSMPPVGFFFVACPGFFPFDPFLYCLNPFVLHVMRQVSYRGPTDMRRQATKFSRPVDLTHGVYAPLI